MRSIESSVAFPLSAVKPLDRLIGYRAHCLAATRAMLAQGRQARQHSPATGARLTPHGEIEGLPYARDPDNGSLFLAEMPSPAAWATLLAEVNSYRRSPEAFHQDLSQSRTDHVYTPKLEWIKDGVRLAGLAAPRVMEATTPPSALTRLLQADRAFSAVVTVDETQVAMGRQTILDDVAECQAAVLLESLDRVHDPEALLRGVAAHLSRGGLLFVTALVASGFDSSVLGLRTLYLYPPDRANYFTLRGLSALVRRAGFALVEVSTPGVLDVEVVQAHVARDPSIPLSSFERQLLAADVETRQAFQAFLQQQRLSSFARLVARKVESSDE